MRTHHDPIPTYIFPSDPSLTLEFACFHLVVGNQNGALYLIGHFWSCMTQESTLHEARVWTRVNLKSRASLGVSLKL